MRREEAERGEQPDVGVRRAELVQTHERGPAPRIKSALAFDQLPVDAGLVQPTARGDDIAGELVARHVEQVQLQVLVELEVRHHPPHPAPGGFERLERRIVQERAHVVGDRGIDGAEIRPLLGRRILHDMGCDDAVDECVEPTRGRARRLRLTRRSEQPAEELGVSGRFLEAGAAQALESGQPGEQLVGVKVVDPLELHLARRLRQTRPHPPQHIVEVVDVDVHGAPGIERHSLSRRPAAEIAGDQHTHRFAVAAGTPGVRQPEVELKTAWHRSLLPQLRTSLEGRVVLGGSRAGRYEALRAE